MKPSGPPIVSPGPKTIARARLSWVLGLAAAAPVMALAQVALHPFADMSLEELMNETVTSVSKREQRLFDSASAVYVISGEDIRRSGVVHIADAFRAVPGMNVASVNSYQWAVSVRGFNEVYNSKLLVLIDGRPVYNPLFSGVAWAVQQPFLEDLDRIEVIRGPGATIWGSNAVNGVINIVSLDARDTQGGLVFGGAGDVQESLGGVRYGGRINDTTFYRVFVSEQSRDGFLEPVGGTTPDDWKTLHGGFRLDHHPASDGQVTWQGDATRFQNGDFVAHNFNTLVRLTREFGYGDGLEFQAFYDRFQARDLFPSDFEIDTFDVSFQRSLPLTERNALIWGAGYRHSQTRTWDETFPAAIRTDRITQHLASAFVQNDFSWIPDRLVLTTGIKLEHNDYTGWETQPSLRASFRATERQTVWASVSRAVRTPSQLEGGNAYSFTAGPPFVGPGGGTYVPTLVGDRNPAAETLLAYELGYRIQTSHRLSFDVAAFYNDYDELIAYGRIHEFDPGTPAGVATIPYVNASSARTAGAEISAVYDVGETLRFRGAYSYLHKQLDILAGYQQRDFRRAPRHQASLGARWDPVRRLSLDFQTRYIEDSAANPGYVTADARIAWRPGDRLELALVGLNLLEPRHREQAPEEFVTGIGEVPRSIHGKVTWHF